MNNLIAKGRLNEVICPDSINNTAYDFMATHIPFRKISFSMIGNYKNEYLNEDQVFYRIFEDPVMENRHQLITVQGSSGSGKSHFIRWIFTKLQANSLDKKSDEILLIKRGENTLKGTIQQLLNIDAIKNLKNRDVYDRLVKANTTISSSEFMNNVFYKFIIEIDIAEDESLTSLEKSRLKALLQNELFKEKMMDIDGPIERIASKISSNNIGANNGVINTQNARFIKNDFMIDNDFFSRLYTADHKAKSIAKKLTSGDDEDDDLIERIVAFMNRRIDAVVQKSAGIESGDFQQIFSEIRKELYKSNKNLILLIEDITSCTGINMALLEALRQEHTGENAKDKLCKLISIVGTTVDFYRQSLMDNYKDRITANIVIEDGTIGENRDDLLLFFAKYLNAISLEKDTLSKWYYDTGASQNELPIHTADIDWEYYKYADKSINLYPFTRNSILKLYDNMQVNKTPRYILLYIISPALKECLYDKNKFLLFLKEENIHNPLEKTAITKLTTTINDFDIEDKENYKSRAISFIGFWGNGNLLIGKQSEVAGISKTLFYQFGFGKLYEKLLSISDTEPINKGVIEQKEVKQFVANVENEKKYQQFEEILDNWKKGDVFSNPRYLLEELNSIIVSSINWQQEGLPKKRLDILKSKYKDIGLIGFERQEKKSDNVLYLLKANDETYELLKCVGQWIYLGKKSWDFKGAYNCIYFITSWMERYKDSLIEAFRGNKNDEISPCLKYCLVNVLLFKILNKNLNINSLNELTFSDVLSKLEVKSAIHNNEELNDILAYMDAQGAIQTSYDYLVDYFNISLGTGGSKVFLDYYDFNRFFLKMKSNKFVITEDNINLYIKEESNIVKLYHSLMGKIPSAIEKEISNNKNIEDDLRKELSTEEITTLDIKDMLYNVCYFYQELQKNFNVVANKSNTSLKLIENLKAIMISLNSIDNFKKETIINDLFYIVTNDKKELRELIDLLNQVGNDIKSYKEIIDKRYNYLILNRKLNNEDPRFKEIKYAQYLPSKELK